MLGLLIVSYCYEWDERHTELRGHDATSSTDRNQNTGHDLDHDRVVSVHREEVQSHTTYTSAIFPSRYGDSHYPDG
jgi:hypothetical protein